MHNFNEIQLKANGLSFTALEQGEGQVVLCLHGFPDCSRSFRHQIPVLADSGYRVIAPLLRGYEPSSQPNDKDYYLNSMADDIIEFCYFLKQDKVHLVGHDWGAAIAYAAAAKAPEKFASLTTMAVPHFGNIWGGLLNSPQQFLNSWYIAFFQLRGISDIALGNSYWSLVDKLWQDWSPGWDYPLDEIRLVKDNLSRPGVRDAALAYYRSIVDIVSTDGRESFELLFAPIDVPTMTLAGSNDGCLDIALFQQMNKNSFSKGLKLEIIHGVGHFLHQEAYSKVNPLLLSWLQQH